MREPIEYQHFANLVERVAVYTERLENVCKNLEQYKVEIKSDIVEIKTDIKDIDNRVNVLELNKENHSGKMSGGLFVTYFFAGIMAFVITNFIYLHMSNLVK